MEKYPKRILISLILLCSIVICSSESVFAASKTLFSSLQVQEKTNWCWASVARQNGYWWANYNEPITSYPRTQTDIVIHVKGGIVNQGANGSEQVDANKYGAYDHSKANLTAGTGSLSYSTIKAYIEQGKPLAVTQVYNDLSSAHNILVTGYSDGTGYQNVVYCDPFDGNKYTMSYTTFCNGWMPNYFWGYSVYWWNWS